MASAQEIFRQAVPFFYELDGVINGHKFTIKGKGVGDSNAGTMKGKFWCTTGKAPMSWKALSPLLGYGLKCYSNYQVGMANFFQETMPSGYSEDRICRYEDNGVVKSHREISLLNGVIMSKGNVVAENFPEDSPILTQKLKNPVPPQAVTTPYKDGVRSMCNFVFPTESGEYYAGALVTINRPLVQSNKTVQPGPHYQRTELKQFKETDASEENDCVIQEEVIEGYHCSPVGDMY